MRHEPDLDAVRAAARRIEGKIHRTPLMRSRSLDEIAGAELHFKCENLQRGGSFKLRGALNAVLSLDEEQAARGVLTHSSGNFGAALCLAASLRGIAAHVVMPENSPGVKQAAVRAYGGKIRLCAPTLEAREAGAAELREETGGTFLHPYDDHAIIAGQGTAALETLEEEPELDVLMAPVGGGGLMSGCAIAARGLSERIELVGAEPALADDAFRSLLSGQRLPALPPKTIADGLRTSLGERNFPILQRLLAGIVTVEEDAIVAAMRLIWERMKLVVEPSGAVPLAAVLSAPARFAGRRVGLVISGGNLDLSEWMKRP